MSSLLKNKITVIVVGVLLSFCILSAFYYFLEKRYTSAIQVLIYDTEESLHVYADHLISNTAPDELKHFGSQCASSEQAVLDQNLDALTSLSPDQLKTTQFLLLRCAYYYPHQQLLLSKLLTESFSMFEALVKAHGQSTYIVNAKKSKVPVWKDIIELEEKRTQHLVNLINIQMEIVTLLLDGKVSSSEEIHTLRDSSITMRREMVSLRSESQNLRGVVRDL